MSHTPVTPESWWRAAFDAEVAAATVADQKKAGTDGRLTAASSSNATARAR